MWRNSLNCTRCTDYLSSYIDGTLGALRSTAVRDHLAQCRRCRREYEELLRLQTLLRQLPAPAARGDFWPRAHTTVRQHAEARQAGKAQAARRQRLGWAAPLSTRFAASVAPRAGLFVTAGAAFMLIVTLAVPTYRTRSLPPPTVESKRVASNAVPVLASAQEINADALMTLHASHNAALPLADSGRMRYLASEGTREDWQDGALDIH
jgi:anti-sigma factor RsiW